MGAAVWRPRAVAVLALVVGALSERERLSARGLLVGLPAPPPATTRLMERRGLRSSGARADRLLAETAPSSVYGHSTMQQGDAGIGFGADPLL